MRVLQLNWLRLPQTVTLPWFNRQRVTGKDSAQFLGAFQIYACAQPIAQVAGRLARFPSKTSGPQSVTTPVGI